MVRIALCIYSTLFRLWVWLHGKASLVGWVFLPFLGNLRATSAGRSWRSTNLPGSEKTARGERVQPLLHSQPAVTSSLRPQLLHSHFRCACSCTLPSWRQRWRWCLSSQLCWSFRPRPTCASCSRTSEAARSTSTHPVSRLTDVYMQVPTLYLHVPLSQVQVTVFSLTKNAAGVQQRNLVSCCSKKWSFFVCSIDCTVFSLTLKNPI